MQSDSVMYYVQYVGLQSFQDSMGIIINVIDNDRAVNLIQETMIPKYVAHRNNKIINQSINQSCRW